MEKKNLTCLKKVEDLANQQEESGAVYTCSICPGKVMKSMSEVNRHIQSKDHKRRELLPDPNVLAAKRQREQDEKLATAVSLDTMEHPLRKVSRRKKIKSKLSNQLQKMKK